MSVLLLRGNAVTIPLADGSVHCVVTSPPYFGLRAYRGVAPSVWGGDPVCAHAWGAQERGKRKDILPAEELSAGRLGTSDIQEGQSDGGRFCGKCGAWRGCLGNEPTPEFYVEHMVAVFREVRRVLRDDGVAWVVLGDSYGRGKRPAWEGDARRGANRRMAWVGYAEGAAQDEGSDGNLLGIPWRFALAAQADGWILREDVVWAKKSAMPESVSGTRWERHRVKLASATIQRHDEAHGANGSGRVQHGGSISDVRGGARMDSRRTVDAPPNGRALQKAEVAYEGTGMPPRARHSGGLYLAAEPWRAEANGDRPQQDHDGHAFLARAAWRDCEGCEKCAATGGYVLRRGSWRHTRAHEFVFMLTKSLGYYADAEVAKEPLAPESARIAARRRSGNKDRVVATDGDRDRTNTHMGSGVPWIDDGAGRNPRSYLLLGPEPTREAHFATFPTALVEPLILASTSARGCCAKCGAPWARVVRRERTLDGEPATLPPMRNTDIAEPSTAQGVGHWRTGTAARTEGWRPTCACVDAGDPVPCAVLDPFVGSGTVVRVAIKHRLRAIGIDASGEYLREIADRRTRGVQIEAAW